MFTFNILVLLSDLIVATITVDDNIMIAVKQCSMNIAITNLSSQNTFLIELKAFDILTASNYKNKTVSDGSITIDFWIIKVHTSN